MYGLLNPSALGYRLHAQLRAGGGAAGCTGAQDSPHSSPSALDCRLHAQLCTGAASALFATACVFGCAAGAIAVIATYPLDLVRTRLAWATEAPAQQQLAAVAAAGEGALWAVTRRPTTCRTPSAFTKFTAHSNRTPQEAPCLLIYTVINQSVVFLLLCTWVTCRIMAASYHVCCHRWSQPESGAPATRHLGHPWGHNG